MIEKLQYSLDIWKKTMETERLPVGIKFIFTEEEFEERSEPHKAAKMAYCVMVKSATLGRSYKAVLKDFACGGGTRALGLEEGGASFQSGCEYKSFGLYRDLSVARQVVSNVTLCGHRAYGLVIKPLEAFKDEPDMVIMIVRPYDAMRLVQAYTYRFGATTDFKLTGNQAVCSECTAYPFEENKMNISMLCSGTRYLAGWGKEEMGAGIPFGKFIDLCEGLAKTKAGVEGPDAYYIRYKGK